MTRDQLKLLLQQYSRFIADDGNRTPSEGKRCPTCRPINVLRGAGEYSILSHLVWMCHETQRLMDPTEVTHCPTCGAAPGQRCEDPGVPDEAKPGMHSARESQLDMNKVNRWFGFIQGALWALGHFSIDDLRGHVTRGSMNG
jgi:hypothetical protein